MLLLRARTAASGVAHHTGWTFTCKQTFQGNFIGDTGAGWSDWKGEWKLP